MTNNSLSYLTALEIPLWQRRELPQVSAQPAVVHQQTKDISTLDWEALEKVVSPCTDCALHCSRTQTVFGVGNREAELMIIGEAPGFYEDKKGEPFVGRAGQLLDAILKALKLDRGQVYIANILKCRPPNNRDPLPEEVAACTPYLQRQIALVKPKLLVAVGRIAAHHLLGTKQALGQLRGKVHHYGEAQTPLLVSYHPAYLLRNPKDKQSAWVDWQRAQGMLSGGIV